MPSVSNLARDEEKMFTLEKLEVEEGQYSRVSAGHVQTGDTLSIFLAGKHMPPKEIDDVHYIEVGMQVLLTRGITAWLNTSPVKEIVDIGDDYIKFRTNTYLYLLTQTRE